MPGSGRSRTRQFDPLATSIALDLGAVKLPNEGTCGHSQAVTLRGPTKERSHRATPRGEQTETVQDQRFGNQARHWLPSTPAPNVIRASQKILRKPR